jgi:hypothetical protein
MSDRDYSQPVPGYPDLRVIDHYDNGGQITGEVQRHVQSLIDSGTLHQLAHHPFRKMASKLAGLGVVSGMPEKASPAGGEA